MMSEYSFSSTYTEPYRYTLPSSRSPSRTLRVVVIGWCIMYHVMTLYVFGQISFLAAYSGALVPGRKDQLALGNITLLAGPEPGHRRNRFLSDSNSRRRPGFETSITDLDRYTAATFGKGVHMMSEYSFSSTYTEPYRYRIPTVLPIIIGSIVKPNERMIEKTKLGIHTVLPIIIGSIDKPNERMIQKSCTRHTHSPNS